MDPHAVATLRAIMAALRSPGTGCPWDIEQTFGTIAPYTIEEAYEVADAIETGDMDALRDELGDLLLQVVYHAQMAEEADAFCFADVVARINAKMIRRHPHVFGSPAQRSEAPSKGFWEDAKAQERHSECDPGTLDGVARALPALVRADKLQKRAARAKFDWPSRAGVVAKFNEELAEIAEALASGDEQSIHDEFGDALFSLVNYARHCGVDPEAALRSANAKFERRFAFIEDRLNETHTSLEASSPEELDELWRQAKDQEC